MIHLATTTASLLLIALMAVGSIKSVAGQPDPVGTDALGVCPLRMCCEEDCCGPETSWQSPTCLPNPASDGFDGTYSPEYVWGCNLRKCCDSACCGPGTAFNADVQRCIPTIPPVEPTISPAPSVSPAPVAPGSPSSSPTACHRSIRIKSFCIRGTPPDDEDLRVKDDPAKKIDPNSVKDYEVMLRLQNNMDYYGIEKVAFKKCLDLKLPKFVEIENHDTINLGFREFNDDKKPPEHFSVEVKVSDIWDAPDCRPPYEYYVYYDYKTEEITACYKVPDTFPIPAGTKRCSAIKPVKDSYLWIIEVRGSL